MKKDELKSGMSIMLRDGRKGLLVDVDGCLAIQYEDSWDEISYYSYDLTSTRPFVNGKDFDIVAVYKCGCGACLIRENLCLKDNLIWERKEPTEITMQEIADKFGIPINDLKIKKANYER